MDQLHTIKGRLANELSEMNDIIRSSLATSSELMNQVVANHLTVKGKQIRPIMVILSAGLFGNVNSHTLCAGAALELLHNASLIHDDVVDETVLRRGNATVNAREGNHVAVLVGDYFVSTALAVGLRTGDVMVVQALSDLGKELSLGEIDQICNARRRHYTEESYFDVISKKTASLFRNCARMGARTAGASEEEARPLVEYADLLGLCFQIKDDILDYAGTDQIGKPTGNDLREGKVTLPLIHALGAAPSSEAEGIEALLERGDLTDSEIADVVAFALRHDGIGYAEATMRRLRAEGERILSVYPDSIWRQSLLDIFNYIISRNF